MKIKLAIITSHPIQYNAPLFEFLSKRNIIEVKVFYTWGETVLKNKYDPGFGKVIAWDIPLLKGYAYEFLENTAIDKGSHHFKGIINPGIIETINNFHPDAVMVYGWAFKSHLQVMRYFKNKVPVLFRGDSNLLDATGFLASLKRTLFLKWVYRFTDIALYVGKNNYRYFRKAGLKEKQLVFAPHAIDNDRFICNNDDCLQSSKELKASLNIPEKDFIFLFAGKLEPKKDPEILIRAFLGSGFGSAAHLVIVGNGIMEKELKDQYIENKQIHFVDFQNQLQMPSVYAMADVFVLPSKGPGETWGLSVNEAMANGKPVIVSSKCGCSADLVENGINGYVFEATNVQDLQNKLKLIYSKKTGIGLMQQRSIEKIKMYSFENVAVAIEEVLKKQLQ